jgi:hypothetical protein
MDINKLSRAEQIIGVAAIVFILSTFLPWFSISVDGFGVSQSESGNGWDVGFLWGRFPALLALAMLVVIILDKLTSVELPDPPVSWGQIHLGLGVLIAFLVILKLIIGEDGGASSAELALMDDFGIEISRAWGLFVAVLAAIGLAVGGFFKFQEDGGKVGGTSSTPPTEF